MNPTVAIATVLPRSDPAAAKSLVKVSSAPGRPQRLSPAASLLLDIVRFLAAVAVLMGHFTQSIFSVGLPDMMPWASGAVGVFFVLSGFIIRYVTLYREAALPEYLADRVSRLLSVVMPALGFTVVADLISRHLQREALPDVGDYLLRVFASLSFMSETWFQDLTPFGNGPFWSLSFEALYYVLYGVGFYLRGWKRIAWLFVAALFAGPAILMLAPIWLLGACLFDLYRKLLPSRRRSLLAVAALVALAAAAAGAVAAIPHGARLAARAWALHLSLQLLALRLYKVNTWCYESSIPAALALLALLLLFDRVRISARSRAVRFMRYAADGTFPLYLFHFPMLLMIRAVVPYNHASRWQLTAVFFAVIATCIVLGGPCNRLKDILRGWFLKEAW